MAFPAILLVPALPRRHFIVAEWGSHLLAFAQFTRTSQENAKRTTKNG
jgi:hypothetical protein